MYILNIPGKLFVWTVFWGIILNGFEDLAKNFIFRYIFLATT